jgi:pimeloyl-ACP methyl ester carboxylesterase
MPFDASRVRERRLPDGASFDLYVPPGEAACLLVSVLPVSEPDVPRALAIELFADFADAHGCLVLAPGFAYESDFRLMLGESVRWDLRLLAMVEDIGRAHAIDVARFDLVGYSAGGQFAQRFLYAHPERLGQVAIGAPGRVALPSAAERWPDGVADLGQLTGRAFDPEAMRCPRILLWVGTGTSARTAWSGERRPTGPASRGWNAPGRCTTPGSRPASPTNTWRSRGCGTTTGGSSTPRRS